MKIALTQVLSQLDEYLEQCSILFQPQDPKTPYFHHTTETLLLRATPQDHELYDATMAERQCQITDLTQEVEQVTALGQKLDIIQAKLKEHKSRVQELIKCHRALTSPVRRLSPEILGEIFMHCLPESLYIEPRIHKYPLVLTRVCQRWRSVAMATPRLWSSLTISLHKAVRVKYRVGCDTWLARAGGIPLSLLITNNTEMFDALADWVQSLIARCCDLQWDGTTFGSLTLSGSVDLLERLYVEFDCWGDIPAVRVLRPAHKLRSVHLGYFGGNVMSLDRITLPWGQLTEIKLWGELNQTSCLQLLELCPCLRSVLLDHIWKDDDYSAIYPVKVTNQSLKVLETRTNTIGLEELFEVLILPSLEELSIGFVNESMKWPHAEFISFLADSRCSLKKLIIDHKSASHYISEYQELLPASCIVTRP